MDAQCKKLLLAGSLAILCAISLYSQSPTPSEPVDKDEEEATLFPHSKTSPIWISGQINLIHQQHAAFHARYTSENSLKPFREKATSRLLTLYTGVQLPRSTELLFDVESAGGRESAMLWDWLDSRISMWSAIPAWVQGRILPA